MANPNAGNSLAADSKGNPLLSDRQTTVADVAATTAYAAVTDMTDPVAVAEGEAVSAALAVAVTELTALRAQVVAMNAVLEAHGLSADA